MRVYILKQINNGKIMDLGLSYYHVRADAESESEKLLSVSGIDDIVIVEQEDEDDDREYESTLR